MRVLGVISRPRPVSVGNAASTPSTAAMRPATPSASSITRPSERSIDSSGSSDDNWLAAKSVKPLKMLSTSIIAIVAIATPITAIKAMMLTAVFDFFARR